MKFDTPAGKNPIDQLKVIGKPADRIDGPLKTTGLAAYAYERHDVVANQAYGFVVDSPHQILRRHKLWRGRNSPLSSSCGTGRRRHV